MSKVDAAAVEEPVQIASRLSLQTQVADPEGVTTVGDEENPEFKLPKMSSLVVVLVTNVLLQVISHFFPA